MNKNDKLFEYAQLLEDYERAVDDLRELQVQLSETRRHIEEAHQALFKFVEDHLNNDQQSS